MEMLNAAFAGAAIRGQPHFEEADIMVVKKKGKSDFKQWIDKNPLRKWREGEEVTLNEAAARLERSIVSLRNWETGVTTPSDDGFDVLERVMGKKHLREEWTSWSTSRPTH